MIISLRILKVPTESSCNIMELQLTNVVEVQDVFECGIVTSN